MIGLGILVFFILVAIFAPLLADKCDLSPTCHHGSSFTALLAVPAGHRRPGPFGARPRIWGTRIRCRRAGGHAITVVIGTSFGLVAGYFGAWRETY